MYNERQKGINIKQLSQQIGQSYQYTVLVTEDLAKRGLITKQAQGVESILRPNEENPIIDWVKKLRV